MKASELIRELEKLVDSNGDFDVVVTATGGLAGFAANVVRVLRGFDWHNGKHVIETDPVLSIESDKHKRIRAARAKIANAMMRSVRRGQPYNTDPDFVGGVESLDELEAWKWNPNKKKPK